MVALKVEALRCNDCRGKDGRMDWKALGYAGGPRSGGKQASAGMEAERAGK